MGEAVAGLPVLAVSLSLRAWTLYLRRELWPVLTATMQGPL